MQRRARRDGDDRRRQRRLLLVRDGRAERRADAGRAGREPAVRRPLERGRDDRRHARRPADLVLRHLAGRRSEADAQAAQQAARRRTGSRSTRRPGGRPTPPVPGATAAILFPFPAAVPNADLAAPVVEVRDRRRSGADPARRRRARRASGRRRPRSRRRRRVGQLVTSRLIFKPDWPGVVSAIGGGPQIVRDGAPVFRAGERSRRASSRRGRRAPASGSSPTGASSSSPSTAASPGTRSE